MAGSQLDQIVATVDNKEFEDDDVAAVYIAIKILNAQWRDIGTALGISSDKLDEIEGNCSKMTDRLNRVLVTWVRQNYDTGKFALPSWRTVCTALAAVSENKKFIRELAQQHGGKIPQEGGAAGATAATTTTSPEETLLKAQPKIGDFSLMKYKGKDGSNKKVKIINSASGSWREVAQQLFDDIHYVDNLKDKHRDNATECLREVFTDFLTKRLSNKYTRDWNGVIELFDDLDQEILAVQIKEAVLNQGK